MSNRLSNFIFAKLPWWWTLGAIIVMSVSQTPFINSSEAPIHPINTEFKEHQNYSEISPRNDSLEVLSGSRNLDEDTYAEDETQHHNGALQFRKIDTKTTPVGIERDATRDRNNTVDTVQSDYYDGDYNLSRSRADKRNMSCWSCSSLVIRICEHLYLHGLPKSWQEELWDDCTSGYCGYYEWRLDYGEGITIVQRECVQEDPANFCETKKAILRLLNTTAFGDCTTCNGDLCNKQNPVYVARQSFFHIFVATFLVLGYKFFAR